MSGSVLLHSRIMAIKAIRHDSDVEAAGHEGEVKGRNSKIEEKLRRCIKESCTRCEQKLRQKETQLCALWQNRRNRGPVSDLRVRCKYEQRGEPEVSGEQCADIEWE